jgi:hypothetical protein
MMGEQPRAPHGQHQHGGFSGNPLLPTLTEAGIDKKLTHGARTYARMTDEEVQPLRSILRNQKSRNPAQHAMTKTPKENITFSMSSKRQSSQTIISEIGNQVSVAEASGRNCRSRT